MTDHIDIVFDGPPAHESGRFVEVEDASGKSINVGEWIDRGNGLWALRLPTREAAVEACAKEADRIGSYCTLDGTKGVAALIAMNIRSLFPLSV